jgi:ribosomal protein S18 acetylase RimI-like enzyme
VTGRLEIRPVAAGEEEAVGDLTLAAYSAIGELSLSDGYADELLDVKRRAADAVVLVALLDGRLIGGVTYVPDASSTWAEDLQPGEAGIRMLAVHPDAQGAGAGRALTQECIDQATAARREAVFLHSTPWMTAAHSIYTRLGFLRVPDRDWVPVPEVPLWAFRLELGR